MTDGSDLPDLAAAATPMILVVDDDEGTRNLVTLALARAGLEVIQAGGAREALDLLAVYRVDVVVSDVGMPGMSGIDLVRALRAEPSSATLPVILITGSGDEHSVIVGLEAGADDFLPKPVRLDELVARVRAHMRSHEAWTQVIQTELRTRAGIIDSLGNLRVSTDPDEAAVYLVTELASRIDAQFVALSQVTGDGRISELATYDPEHGVVRGSQILAPDLAGYLMGRAQDGPWVDEVAGVGLAEPSPALRAAAADIVATAPLYAGGLLVGLLTLGALRSPRGSIDQRRRLLASAIDYASVLELHIGQTIAGRQTVTATRARLQAVLDAGAFQVVVQPIVDLETGAYVGFEGLTRFDDGVRPDMRFAEAASVGLGPAFETAAIERIVAASRVLPKGTFLSVNASPNTVAEAGPALMRSIAMAGRPVVIEVTEHVPIDDYERFRSAIHDLGPDVRLAVDDAGAGFASLRHILELEPRFAKLDISLVRGIDADDLRQSMAAGLNYFALRTGSVLIAEGVETEAEADTLREMGIELAQGYLFARPAPAETFASPSP